MKQRILVFGTGKAAQRVLPRLRRKYDVLGFVDNNKLKHGRMFVGLPVLAPSAEEFSAVDLVIVASMHVEDIYHQLVALGVPADKIIIKSDLGFLRLTYFFWDNLVVLLHFFLLTLGAIKIFEIINSRLQGLLL
jgi:hypothetical protein